MNSDRDRLVGGARWGVLGCLAFLGLQELWEFISFVIQYQDYKAMGLEPALPLTYSGLLLAFVVATGFGVVSGRRWAAWLGSYGMIPFFLHYLFILMSIVRLSDLLGILLDVSRLVFMSITMVLLGWSLYRRKAGKKVHWRCPP